MDAARISHNAQARLKHALTPLWDQAMGWRLKIARERMLVTQGELAELLSTPGAKISQQQIAKIEDARSVRLNVSWARLDAVMGPHVGFVLIGKDASLYQDQKWGKRYWAAQYKKIGKARKKVTESDNKD
jgi:transcriptional regulator with XRE-family HTH domain